MRNKKIEDLINTLLDAQSDLIDDRIYPKLVLMTGDTMDFYCQALSEEEAQEYESLVWRREDWKDDWDFKIAEGLYPPER